MTLNFTRFHDSQDDHPTHLEGDVLEDDDWVLGGVLLQQSLEVGAAGGQDHLVGLAALAVRGDRDVREGLLVPEVLEAGDHVGLEVVPSQAELLLVVHPGLGSDLSETKQISTIFTRLCSTVP